MARETEFYRLSEDEARSLLERIRWPNGAVCPHCGSVEVRRLQGKSTRPGVHKCRDCQRQFTVTVNTIFHRSKIPLADWVYAFARMCASKKGVSALQLSRELGLTYKTAWHMAHRIRHAMQCEPLRSMLGEVEVDETWVGGKPRKAKPSMERFERRMEARRKGKKIGHTTKTPVVALVERGGQTRTRAVADVTGKTLRRAIEDHVDRSATLMTDERWSYKTIGKDYGGHLSVNHSRGEYWRPDGASTNTVESHFGLIKRTITGSWHHVSKKHLQAYLDECDFRWNHRHVTDRERTVAALRQTEGKRLTYKDPMQTSRPCSSRAE